MHKLWIQAAMMLGGVIRGTIGGALGYLNTLLMSGFTTATKFHQEGIAFARELGMNAKEAQAYTEVLTERTERLAMKYGVAAEQVHELQKNISVATSRQLMLNDSQAEGFLQLNKLVGSSTVSKFTEEMMNGMGGQIDTVQGAVAKAYATAAKSGLSAQKVSEKIANNLGMANRLSFRTGIEGLTRMAMKAEKVGMSLQSVEAAADKFREIDQAIENTARLQMLGGNAAIMGGNPLDIAYEANYDPEALQERMTKMLGGYAQFDAQKGISSINGINMDFVRNIAQAMGISTEEASKIAKKNAENKFKETNINFGAYGNLTQEQRDFLINKSTVANGKTTFTTSSGKEVDLTSGEAIDPEVIKEMMKYEGMSDHEIMAQNAESLTSINEILKGIKESIGAMFSKFIEGLFPEFQGDLKNFGAWAKDKLEPVAKNVGVAVRGVYDWVKENKETFKSLASGVIGFIKFATEHWKILLTVLGGLKLFKLLGNAGIVGRGGGLASSAASAAGRGLSRLSKGSPYALFKQRYANHASRGVTFSQAARSTWRATSKMAKGTAALGAVTGIIQGLGAISEYSRRKEEINNSNMSEAEKAKALNEAQTDRNSEIGGAVGAGVGTVLGTFFFGPLGGMIGGAVGEFTGKFIGKYWTPIVDTVTSFMSKLIDGIKWLAAKSWDGIKWIIDNNPIGLIAKGIGKLVGKDWSITGAISSIFGGGEKHAEGGVVGGNSYTGDKVPILANSGEAVVTPQQFNKLFGMAETILATAPKQNEYTSILNNKSNVTTIIPQETPIHTKPVGEKEYIYTPKNNETSNVNGKPVTVKDFNININGTLKLDGGNSSKNLDIRELLNDRNFVNALKDVVKTAINNDINGGRHMNDLAVMSGLPAQTAIYGR